MPQKIFEDSRVRTFIFWGLLVAAVVSAVLGFLAWNNTQQQQEQIEKTARKAAIIAEATRRQTMATKKQAAENKAIITHLCRVSNSFAGVLDQASASARVNLKTGVYQRLVRNGTLTEADVEEIKRSIRKYEKTSKGIKSPDSPCKPEK